MSDTQQKIVPLTRFVAALAPEPYLLSESASVNVRSTLERMRPDFLNEAKLDDVLDELPGRFLSSAGIERGQAANLQLKVIGYSELDRAVKVLQLDGLTEPIQLHSTVDPGVDWFGFVDVATRIVKGNSAISTAEIAPGPEVEYHIPTALMSLQDALDISQTLVHTTATFGKFVRAVVLPNSEEPSERNVVPLSIPVGGPVQSAILRPSGFSWVVKPAWASTREGLTPPDPGLPPT